MREPEPEPLGLGLSLSLSLSLALTLTRCVSLDEAMAEPQPERALSTAFADAARSDDARMPARPPRSRYGYGVPRRPTH